MNLDIMMVNIVFVVSCTEMCIVVDEATRRSGVTTVLPSTGLVPAACYCNYVPHVETVVCRVERVYVPPRAYVSSILV